MNYYLLAADATTNANTFLSKIFPIFGVLIALSFVYVFLRHGMDFLKKKNERAKVLEEALDSVMVLLGISVGGSIVGALITQFLGVTLTIPGFK